MAILEPTLGQSTIATIEEVAVAINRLVPIKHVGLRPIVDRPPIRQGLPAGLELAILSIVEVPVTVNGVFAIAGDLQISLGIRLVGLVT